MGIILMLEGHPCPWQGVGGMETNRHPSTGRTSQPWAWTGIVVGGRRQLGTGRGPCPRWDATYGGHLRAPEGQLQEDTPLSGRAASAGQAPQCRSIYWGGRCVKEGRSRRGHPGGMAARAGSVLTSPARVPAAEERHPLAAPAAPAPQPPQPRRSGPSAPPPGPTRGWRRGGTAGRTTAARRWGKTTTPRHARTPPQAQRCFIAALLPVPACRYLTAALGWGLCLSTPHPAAAAQMWWLCWTILILPRLLPHLLPPAPLDPLDSASLSRQLSCAPVYPVHPKALSPALPVAVQLLPSLHRAEATA